MCHLWSELTTTNRDYIMQLAKAAGEDTKIVRNQGAESPGSSRSETALARGNWSPRAAGSIFDIYHKNVADAEEHQESHGDRPAT